VRERLMQSETSDGFAIGTHAAASTGLKAFLRSGQAARDKQDVNEIVHETKPIADLFPEVRCL
jgi:hypothetical protein